MTSVANLIANGASWLLVVVFALVLGGQAFDTFVLVPIWSSCVWRITDFPRISNSPHTTALQETVSQVSTSRRIVPSLRVLRVIRDHARTQRALASARNPRNRANPIRARFARSLDPRRRFANRLQKKRGTKTDRELCESL